MTALAPRRGNTKTYTRSDTCNPLSSPSDPRTSTVLGWDVRGYNKLHLSVGLPVLTTITSFDFVILARSGASGLQEVRNGRFTAQTTFSEVLDISGVDYLHVYIDDSAGVGTQAMTFYAQAWRD
jgi:hypothetical protein